MIKIGSDKSSGRKPVKAVGMISGGLDSTLAAKIMSDLGVDVHGVYFAMPWGCCHKKNATAIADKIGIKLVVLQLDERYLEIVRKPQHGYGTALNPCVDCRIHMFSRAAEYMRHINAEFVFTGEVLGQRPMSQKRDSMACIEKRAGLEGRLLRPLSAQLLEPTIPETEGLIDRQKLLQLNGRSRKPQYDLAHELQISEFSAPAGGCLLTDHNFAQRMRDTFQYGYRNFRETVALQWGRHYRFNENFKVIVGRDETENNALTSYAHPEDTIMEYEDQKGPTCIIKGNNPHEDILSKTAGIIQHFSKRKENSPGRIIYWKANDKNKRSEIQAKTINEHELEQLKI